MQFKFEKSRLGGAAVAAARGVRTEEPRQAGDAFGLNPATPVVELPSIVIDRLVKFGVFFAITLVVTIVAIAMAHGAYQRVKNCA